MKKIVIILTLSLLSLAVNCYSAGTARVNWDNNSEGDIKGYNVYYGTISGNYLSSVYTTTSACNSLGCSIDINNLIEGQTYYFALKAVDFADQESPDYSIEVSKHIESSYAIDGVSVSQVFINLDSGSYDLIVMADGTFELVSKGNYSPTVSLSTIPTEIIEGEGIVLTATASDPENDLLTYSWYLDGTFYGYGNTTNLVDLIIGSHSVYCSVTDGHNTVNTNASSITVLDGPHILLPSILEITANYGDETAVGQLTVVNNGNGEMYWDVSTTSNMLMVDQVSGINNATITVTADILGLEPGDYFGDFIITSSDADNSPQTVPVKVSIMDPISVGTAVSMSPENWSWAGGIPEVTSEIFYSDGPTYKSTGVDVIENQQIITISDNTRYLTVPVYLKDVNSAMVLQLQKPGQAWIQYVVSPVDSCNVGYVMDWGTNYYECYSNQPIGQWIMITIDLSLHYSLGDSLIGIAFSSKNGDYFSDLIF
jgi:hypothetical protein